MKLVLASSSPRRAELLRNAGITVEVQPANVPEVRREGEAAVDFAMRAALEKAQAVARLRPRDLVVAADTIVCLGEEVLGKPRDAADAARMLRALSARTHTVTTGVALAGDGRDEVAQETTRVWMAEIGNVEIAEYVASGEPMDKAGAYAIQGRASRWVTRIEGCYFNVVGLPVPLVWRMLNSRRGESQLR